MDATLNQIVKEQFTTPVLALSFCIDRDTPASADAVNARLVSLHCTTAEALKSAAARFANQFPQTAQDIDIESKGLARAMALLDLSYDHYKQPQADFFRDGAVLYLINSMSPETKADQ